MPPDRTLQPVALRPLPPTTQLRHSLPHPLTSFIGREREVAAINALLGAGVRLLTLLGPGGVGKTRLAVRVAEEQAERSVGGVVFVSLSDITDEHLLLPAIMQALDLRQVDGRTAEETVTSWLRERQVLLVLDNFEQVVHAALHVGRLLAACPQVTVVVTSREPLRLAGEQRFPVLPLAVPAPAVAPHGEAAGTQSAIADAPAVQLFVERAQAVNPVFELVPDNALAVAELCRVLDGLPLAIELAAARSALLSPQQLRDRLHAVLPMLVDGPLDAPVRLQTMRNAIAWSYDLLPDEEQRTFRWLAIFAEDFDLAAAGAVLDGANPADASEAERVTMVRLGRLVEKSLLVRVDDPYTVRFAMLATVRAFGLDMLVAAGEQHEAATRHAVWYTRLAEQVRRSGTLSRREGLFTLDAAHPNLRLALAWLLETGQATRAMHLAAQLAEFWLRRGHLTEGQSWLEQTLNADLGPPTVARAEALVGLNMLLWPGNAWARAASLLTNAEEVARATGDAGALAYVRLHQGYVAAFQGDHALSTAEGQALWQAAAAIPQGFSQHGAVWLMARSALARGEPDEARACYTLLVEQGRAAGDDISHANGLVGLGLLAQRGGDNAGAVASYAGAAQVAQGYEDCWFVCNCLEAVAHILTWREQPDVATRLLAAADTLRARTHAPLQVYVEHQAKHRQALTLLQARLGQAEFAASWTAGAALDLTEAIALAAGAAGALPEGENPAGARALLTAREREVLRYVERGWSDKEIAAELAISRRTVSNHIAALRAKLQAPSRSAAVAIAVRDELI
jgi:predicted ATPase/DNA-binding CsgD family transcriptional regulator